MTFLNCDVELRDLLLEYKVYDSWQFVTNSIKNLETAEYCSDLIRRLLDAMDEEDEYIDLLQYRRYKKEIFNSPCAFVIHDIKVNSIKPFFMSGTMKQIGFDDGSF